MLAWIFSACTFIFYGAAMCHEKEYQQVLADQNLIDVYALYLEEGGADFLNIDGDYDGCELLNDSHFMTAAFVCYFLAGAILCW